MPETWEIVNGKVVPSNKELKPGVVFATQKKAQDYLDSLTPPPTTKTTVNNVGWKYSDRMVADYVYKQDGKIFFLYDISSVTGKPTYIAYEAVGLTNFPSGATVQWDADSLGNERYGKGLSTVRPAGWDIISSYNFDTGTYDIGTRLTMQNFTVARTEEGTNLGDWIGYTMEGLQQLFPYLYEEVEGRLPAIGLVFNSLISGSEITEEQLSLAGVGQGYTKLGLSYLNAIIAASSEEQPYLYNKVDENGNIVQVANQKYMALEKTVTNAVERALGNLGFNASVFKQDNAELFQGLVSGLIQGDIEYDQYTGDTTEFENYIGYKLGVEGYSVDKDSYIMDLYNTINDKVSNPGEFNPFIDFDSFKLSNQGLQEMTRILGAGKVASLSGAEKKRLLGLYARDNNAGLEEFQRLFDSDPLFERFANKGLNYSLIAGNYKNQYSQILGDVADETSSVFLDSLAMSYQDAKKSYMDYGYKTGNKKYMQDLASSLQQSLGGVVIR